MTHRRTRSLVTGASVLSVLAGLGMVGTTSTSAVAATARCTVFFDANGDGADDLPVGAPGENVGTSAADAGTVTLVYGDPAGRFGGSGSRVLDQEDVGLVSKAGDRSGPRSPRPTSTATVAPTSPSASPVSPPAPGPSWCCTAPPSGLNPGRPGHAAGPPPRRRPGG